MAGELISVVIPTYNRAGTVVRAIDSVVAQTHGNLEVIVVDDGSTDGTADLIAERYGADPRVRWVTQANQGVSAARNRGLAVARGDYVALLDSDDSWMPWKLEVQVGCLRVLPAAGMIWTDMEAIDPDGRVVSRSYLRTMYRGAYRWFPETSKLFASSRPLAEIFPNLAAPLSSATLYWGDIYSPMIMGNLVHTSTVLLRRERFARVRGFDEALRISGEDYDFHLRTCREGPVAFVDVSSIQYQVGRPDQLSHRAYAIHMARNFLTTVSRALNKDEKRIHLPARMIHAVQAFALGWVGVELIELGENTEALGYLGQSLRHRAWQPKLWIYYVLSLLPSRLGRFVLARLHDIAHALRTLAHRQTGP